MTVQTHALLAGLTVIAVVVIVRLVRRQVLKAKYTVLWLTVGLVLAVTASVPTLLDRAADRLGIWYQPTLSCCWPSAFCCSSPCTSPTSCPGWRSGSGPWPRNSPC